jgi:predicted helicase
MDTLDNMGFDYKNKQSDMFGLSEENTERIKRQNERKISVIFGNPPYNANQMNENDNNKNREYPIIDKRIKDTFIKQSTAQKTKLYDMYSRFYRWAMDRLGDEGIIAFITNRSFINSRTFDGFRKIVASEFDHIYIVDLGGDVRSNPKLSGPKHNVFAIQAGVAIMFLVKTLDNKIVLREDEEEEFKYLKKSLKLTRVVSEPEVSYGDTKYISPKGCRIYYIRRPEMETAKDKLEFLSTTKLYDLIKNGSYEHIMPDKLNNWIELTDNDWEELIPTISYDVKTSNLENTIFKIFSNGISTNRDSWVYDEDKLVLENKVIHFINRYNNLLAKSKKDGFTDDLFVDDIKWSHAFKNKFRNFKYLTFDPSKITWIYYRPFKKLYYYSDFDLSDLITTSHFEISGKNLIMENQLIWFKCGITSYFFSLGINKVHDIMPNGGSKCLPLYRYDESGNRIENITDWGLWQFRGNYENTAITKEDIFHYVYAVLHNPEYRTKYEMNLKREFPRIPFYDDFWKWAALGKQLMDLHINFETVEPYPLRVSGLDNSQPLNPNPNTPKPKLKADKLEGRIIIDEETILEGIPKEVWEYKLGNRSALEWILDQYKEKTPKDPTIREKFNTYKFIDYKDKVIDLLMRVTTVSVETVRIVKEMEKDLN